MKRLYSLIRVYTHRLHIRYKPNIFPFYVAWSYFCRNLVGTHSYVVYMPGMLHYLDICLVYKYASISPTPEGDTSAERHRNR